MKNLDIWAVGQRFFLKLGSRSWWSEIFSLYFLKSSGSEHFQFMYTFTSYKTFGCLWLRTSLHEESLAETTMLLAE
jgi:hypothetical protein